jgi:feruloyl esterase
MPGGASLDGGYQTWITGPALDRNSRAAGWQFSSEVMKYFIYHDPAHDILKSDLGAKYDRDRLAPGKVLDAVDPDLSTFVKHGGKLIQYHGWNDPGIAPLGSVRYRSELISRMGGVDGFYRLYMIPGMLHCAGGAGPGVVDWVTVMDDWVSHAKPPAALVATAGANKQAKAQSQLVCPYPQVARGSGDTAAGWRCEAPKPVKKG